MLMTAIFVLGVAIGLIVALVIYVRRPLSELADDRDDD
jgi:uncharacterized membrane protein YciS (DUF1049 family)